MKKTLALLMLLTGRLLAQEAAPAHVYPAHSWTYNVDFKDLDALGMFIGRDLVEGQWKGGTRWKPLRVYHVTEATGEARGWASAGVFLVTNAEKVNVTFGPILGLDVLEWSSQARFTGPIESGAKFWKPLRLASLTASVDFWGGWTPLHTADVLHNWCGGFGFSLKGRFGYQGSLDAANAILKAGL